MLSRRLLSTRAQLLNTLNLTETASKKEIKSRYFELSKIHHPDKNSHLSDMEAQASEEHYLKIKAAYEGLMNPALVMEANHGNYSSRAENSSHFYYEQPSSNLKKIIFPWVGATGLAVIAYSYVIISNTEKRADQVRLAWTKFAKEREKDGLSNALGYTDK
jgi:curved DNA-binding protein CbpA